MSISNIFDGIPLSSVTLTKISGSAPNEYFLSISASQVIPSPSNFARDLTLNSCSSYSALPVISIFIGSLPSIYIS